MILYDPEFLNRNRIGLILNKCDTSEDFKEATKIIKSLKHPPTENIQGDVPIPNLEEFRFDFIMPISAINIAEKKKQLIKSIRHGFISGMHFKGSPASELSALWFLGRFVVARLPLIPR